MKRHDARDDGFDDFLDAIESGEGFYLECENGHGSLPPRRLCPHCGSDELAEVALPETGTIETFTVVRVAAPEFEADTPYVTAVVDFGGVRATGQMRGVEVDAVETGMEVEAGIGETETTGERILVFHPR
ncbi:Zn-ribbon domain-containing OB-fold protein [Halorussus halophilus]|uniref:Zn-ribbon domain-containing OB-fold protein n=1 Tax=Halorussus halophilus TaxID=2650975 RepID=UPI001301161F|nr:Zn-ribbon domain-containing OB-fold protein [Halorussus halophilus]